MEFPEHDLPKVEGFSFHNEYPGLSIGDTRDLESWLSDVLKSREMAAGRIDFHFLSDEELLQINIDHLNHYYYTDIITFPYTQDPLSSEIFISIDRVKENAEDHNENFDVELNRVMVHGLLHLVGLGDKTASETKAMRSAESRWLDNWHSRGHQSPFSLES